MTKKILGNLISPHRIASQQHIIQHITLKCRMRIISNASYDICSCLGSVVIWLLFYAAAYHPAKSQPRHRCGCAHTSIPNLLSVETCFDENDFKIFLSIKYGKFGRTQSRSLFSIRINHRWLFTTKTRFIIVYEPLIFICITMVWSWIGGGRPIA